MDGNFRYRSMRSHSKAAPNAQLAENSAKIFNFGQGADNFTLPINRAGTEEYPKVIDHSPEGSESPSDDATNAQTAQSVVNDHNDTLVNSHGKNPTSGKETQTLGNDASPNVNITVGEMGNDEIDTVKFQDAPLVAAVNRSFPNSMTQPTMKPITDQQLTTI